MAEGDPRHRGDCLDGRTSLPAAPVRLSRRREAGLGGSGDLQGHGIPAAALHHGAGERRRMDHGAIARLDAGGLP